MIHPAPGRIVLLNGTSSSGKTTLVRALQRRLDGPWLDLGIDRFLFALPGPYLDAPRWSEVFRYGPAEPGSPAPFRIHVGPLGDRLVRAMHRAVATMSDQGFDCLVDHVLLGDEWLDDLVEAWSGRPVLSVGVRCPLEVVVRREAERGDRTLGQAAAQHDVVHRRGGYDLEVDTSDLAPAEAAEAIAAAVEAGLPSVPFSRVRPRPGQAR